MIALSVSKKLDIQSDPLRRSDETAASSPLTAIFSRIRRIDPEEASNMITDENNMSRSYISYSSTEDL